MSHTDNNEIKNLISIDTFNDTSLFAVAVVNLSNYEVVYSNQAMKNIMSDMTAKNCWESIYGQEVPCMWCKAPSLLSKFNPDQHHSQSTTDAGYHTREHFNEVANRWYQLQEKVVRLKDSRNVLISFALDISIQKEAQSKLIETHVKLAMQTKALEEAQAELKEQANRDPLTNIYNSRYFGEISEKIIAITKRTKEPLSLLMIDIDTFKNINDSYGHNVGDEIIKLLANKLTSTIRKSDIVARFGGEEFAVILPNTNIKSAIEFADTLRVTIGKESYETKIDTIQFTISIGVDEFNHQEDTNIIDSLKRADSALYEAKRNGRNMVCAFHKE